MNKQYRSHGDLLTAHDIRPPVEPARSPLYEQAEGMVRDYAERWNIKPPHFEKYNTFAGWMYPNAVSAKRLAAACAIHSTFFFVDDLLFDTDDYDPAAYHIDPDLGQDPAAARGWLRDLMDIFHTGDLPENPSNVELAMQELGEMVRLESTPEWFEVFYLGVMDYIEAVTLRDEDLNGPQESLKSLAAFLKMRERDGGGLHSCQLIELTDNSFMTSAQRQDPTIMELTRLCYLMASLANDIYSYEKDVIREGSNFNTIKLLMDLERLPFDQAQHRAVALANRATDDYEGLYAQAKADGLLDDPNVDRYVTGLTALMGGIVGWHPASGRYEVV